MFIYRQLKNLKLKKLANLILLLFSVTGPPGGPMQGPGPNNPNWGQQNMGGPPPMGPNQGFNQQQQFGGRMPGPRGPRHGGPGGGGHGPQGGPPRRGAARGL